MRIGNVEIGGNNPCRVIAEISNNHNGIKGHALALIGAAKEAGADLVKCQAYLPDELVYLRGNGPAPAPWNDRTMAQLYEEAKTPLEWLPEMFAYAKRYDIPLFASVFGKRSLAALEEVGCPAYKISHFEWENTALRASVEATKKPMVISGPSRYDAGFSAGRGHGVVQTLYCPGGYPCAPSEMCLPAFVYEDGYVTYDGLSSHCKDPLVAPVAVARGAKLLEYHFMLSWAPSKLESNVSLTEQEFAQMVRDVRRTEELLG